MNISQSRVEGICIRTMERCRKFEKHNFQGSWKKGKN